MNFFNISNLLRKAIQVAKYKTKNYYNDRELPTDTYSYLLENPGFHKPENLDQDIQYVSKSFSQKIYEKSRGRKFPCFNDAYKDWVSYGRSRGLYFNDGMSTLIKVILKVKDEPVFLRKWIEYHGDLYGYHNLIIMDCGSTDDYHWSILNEFSNKILIFKYSIHYDKIHAPYENIELFDFIGKCCKYLTILDVDEFIVGFSDDQLSRFGVIKLLEDRDEEFFPGIHLFNSIPPKQSEKTIDWDAPISFGISEADVEKGSIAGKAVVRTTSIPEIAHIGHNLHVRQTIDAIKPDTFGRIIILNVGNVVASARRPRAEKHMRYRGLIPESLTSYTEVALHLNQELARGSISQNDLEYVEAYLNQDDFNTAGKNVMITNLLGKADRETQKELGDVLSNFDFEGLIESRRVKLGPS